MLYQILLASAIGGILSLVGGIILLWRQDFAKKASFYLISFAAGSLLGTAFFEVLPEAFEGGGEGIFGFVLLGILIVFVFERFLGWYHHHDQESHYEHTFSAQSILLGDTLHNFIDGVAIALAFAVDTNVGIATTFAVFFHEIPQEIGDFAILIKRGYSRVKIITYNVLTAVAALVGAVLTYFFLPFMSGSFLYYALAVAAGTFIYISTADLIPELREHADGGFGLGHTVMILVGILVVVFMSKVIPG